MKRALVTGGSGFIGSHVVDKLAEAGIEPVIYDLRPSPHHAPGSVETVIGDLCDTETLCNALQGCDAVIHLAAAADVGIVADEPVAAEEANSRGTLSVLEAARTVGVERVVYGSTIWVYGESEEGTIDEDSAIGLPKHLYTATKLAGEMYCTSYEELYDVPCTILRFGIPYGPRSRPAAVIPIFVGKALAGEPLTIAGDGLQTRRFVYVEDLAEGIVRGLRPEAAGRVFNLASNETVTIRELADVVSEVVGSTEIVHTPGRNGDFGGAEISNERALAELGWCADTPLQVGITRYLDWLRDAPAAAPAPAAPAPAEPTPVPEPEPALAAPVAEPAPLGTATDDFGAVWHEPRPAAGKRFPIVSWAVAVAIGTCLALSLSLGTDDFGTGQTVTVGFLTMAAIFAALSSWRPWSGAAGWGLIALYVVLLILPTTHHALGLAVPHAGTFALAALGTTLALAIVAASDRIPAPEAVTESRP